MRTLHLTLEEALEVCKALANEHRIEILNILNDGPLNVNEIAQKMTLPFSTTAVNVKKLEDAGLLSTEIIPGRGSQKISSKRYTRIVIDLVKDVANVPDSLLIEMPIGDYVDCDIEPTCGLVSETGYLGLQDYPRSFYEPFRRKAQLLWFKTGYVEYRFPNRIPFGAECSEIEISAEVCSEAPYSKKDWPSDITLWINGHELGHWTSPSDFGGERGFLTPNWWETHNTQYGLLKRWRVNQSGSFIDGEKLSEVTIQDLKINDKPYISVKLGVKKDAANVGGLNLFGKTFGNYEQDLLMKIQYVNKNGHDK
ncbi:ArsR/SmtB family transcription factor [Camelliibacillus cellulosilyticus]|uniref:ArsR/SmtB family transcription factor n=1 Tax=Camelliibacillus cellulosilyticus TaxID=2174486 RepID=A0ABV9GM04_9BACL